MRAALYQQKGLLLEGMGRNGEAVEFFRKALPLLVAAGRDGLHEIGRPDSGGFSFDRRSSDPLKDRAFGDLWKRSPRPLFGLLERARLAAE